MANKQQNTDTTVQEVDGAISKTEQFIDKNRNNILYSFVAIVLVVAAVWGINKCSDSSNASAQEEIYAAQQLFELGDYEQALAGFEGVIDEYGSTKAGNLAKAYAGLCNSELGNYAAAIDQLKSFSGSDAVLAPAIMAALGNCYANQNDFVEAAKSYERAASMSNSAQYSPLYLRKAGQAYEKAGNNAEALKIYESIRKGWAETTVGQNIDKYIERVK